MVSADSAAGELQGRFDLVSNKDGFYRAGLTAGRAAAAAPVSFPEVLTARWAGSGSDRPAPGLPLARRGINGEASHAPGGGSLRASSPASLCLLSL